MHESRFAELKEKLVHAYQQIPIGDPLDQKTLMGPLIDEKSVQNVEAAVIKVREAGGEILCGGERVGNKGHFISPIIATAQNEWDIVQDETFGPLLLSLIHI